MINYIPPFVGSIPGAETLLSGLVLTCDAPKSLEPALAPPVCSRLFGAPRLPTLECLTGLCSLIACSSSSAITKRFWRELVARLSVVNVQLLATCSSLQVPCRIHQTNFIYDQAGPHCDRNLLKVYNPLRRLPSRPLLD